MHNERPFTLFSSTHVGTLLVLALVGFLLCWGMKRFAGPQACRRFEISFAVLIAVQYLIERVLYVWLTDYEAREVLPFHLCGISTILTIVLLIAHKRLVFEVLYFWGFIGTVLGMLMPEVEYDFPHYFFLLYFTGHVYIVYGAAYMAVIYGYRPTWASIPKAMVATVIYAGLITPINVGLDVNYLFLRAKPTGAGLMDYFGPWPWYLGVLAALMVVFFVIAYAPWALRDTLLLRRELVLAPEPE
ncbi:MAG: hypothetical conserved membrane protein [Candidatus Hydrogenedentota bacterium]